MQKQSWIIDKWSYRLKNISSNVPQYAMFAGCIISHEVRYSQRIWAEACVASR